MWGGGGAPTQEQVLSVSLHKFPERQKQKGKDIATLVEAVCSDVIFGTEKWLSSDVSSSKFFDSTLGYDDHRNDRADNPQGGVLIAAKKELQLHDVKRSKDAELISGTIKVAN